MVEGKHIYVNPSISIYIYIYTYVCMHRANVHIYIYNLYAYFKILISLDYRHFPGTLFPVNKLFQRYMKVREEDSALKWLK